MGARYEIEELEYASGYEKMYGVTDEQLAFLSRHQDNLRRFEVEPTYDAALDADLERLARKRDELSRHGFDAAREEGSASEAFRVEFAHTTTALEGNGLTLAETAMVLERDLTIPGKPLHDHLEVMDADAAFIRVRKLAADGAPLSEEIVFDVHRLIAAHLEEADPGEYRWDMRYVTSSSMYPPPPARVPELMGALLASSLAHPGVATAALFHLVFEDIHPFGDATAARAAPFSTSCSWKRVSRPSPSRPTARAPVATTTPSPPSRATWSIATARPFCGSSLSWRIRSSANAWRCWDKTVSLMVTRRGLKKENGRGKR